MNSSYSTFKRNLIIKAVVVPIVVTMIVTALAVAAAPIIQNHLPNASAYSQQLTSEEQSNE